MKKICDLHTHSIYSDGTFTPTEIIDEAVKNSVSAIALTDHNTVDGLPNFISAAQNRKINIVPGIEFSADYNGTEIHILGLFISPKEFNTVHDLMSDVSKQKEESNIALVTSLNRAGYKLDYEEIKASTPNGKVNRANIAAEMMKKEYINSIKEGFDTVLSKSAGHYKEPKRLDVKEIIDFISSIRAVSVLAHPFLNLNERELIDLLRTVKGFDGMECYYSSYDKITTEKSVKIVKEFSLICSGGSDFHGNNKPNINIGNGKGNLKVPFNSYLALKECSDNK